jgi:hypothetical protein
MNNNKITAEFSKAKEWKSNGKSKYLNNKTT